MSTPSHRIFTLTKINILLALAVIVVLSIFVLVLLNSQLDIQATETSEEITFCNEEDVIFQAINNEKDDWIDLYRTMSPSDEGTYPAFSISTPQGRGGLVRPFYSESNGAPIFYVVTESRWPGTQPYGVRGYWYSPNGNLPSNNRLHFQLLKQHIYCYWFN